MKIISEISLKDFEFWSGAEDRAKNCTDDDFDAIEELFEELYPEGMTDTEVNDFFWFEFDTLAQHLGYENEEDFERKRDPDYLDDDDLGECVEDWLIDKIVEWHDDNESLMLLIELFSLDDQWDDAVDMDPEAHPANFLRHWVMSGELDLWETLFEDDNGEYETSGLIPSKEDFRDEMIDKRKNLRNNE